MTFLAKTLRFSSLVASFFVSLPTHAAPAVPTPAVMPAASAACPAVLKHSFNRLQDEAPQNLCQYAGKVVLVVNTASYCGFTNQYEGLEALYGKYPDGHPKLLHLWPPKLPQAGRPNYQLFSLTGSDFLSW